jgi:hypothetical protein
MPAIVGSAGMGDILMSGSFAYLMSPTPLAVFIERTSPASTPLYLHPILMGAGVQVSPGERASLRLPNRGVGTMTLPVLTPGHIDEPRAAHEYADVLSRVAGDRQPIIVRRGGADLVAVVPLEYLELSQELLAREEAERLAAALDWDKLVKTLPPPQAWFDGDEPRPF